LLPKILEADSNTSNTFKYLELGIYPIRFEIMKRKIIFLQYILQQEKESMMYKVFKATCDAPVKKDFVNTCDKYLKMLDIKLTFTEISEMSKHRFKQLVKQKTTEAAFIYLISEKNKRKKMSHLKYSSLEMQEYLLTGNRNISQLIFKARGRNLEIKTHNKLRYDDNICVGCGKNSESEEELLSCPGFCDKNEIVPEIMSYSCLFGGSLSQMLKVAKVIKNRLKVRLKLLEEPD
jgi:hypothetical protein